MPGTESYQIFPRTEHIWLLRGGVSGDGEKAGRLKTNSQGAICALFYECFGLAFFRLNICNFDK